MNKPGRAVRVGLIVFAVALSAGALGCSSEKSAEASGDKAAEYRVPVVLTSVRAMVFEERIEVSGNIEAKSTAIVSARIPGVLDEIYVDDGDTVQAGKTKLFQTDKVKLTQAVEATEQQVAVAAAAVGVREATVARVEADLAKAKIDFDRYKRLYEKDHAVTKNALEVQDSRFKQVQAALGEAKAGLELARAQQRQAGSGLAIARKDLSDSLVVSPITGEVCRRMLEPGEMAGAGTPVLRVDDLRVVELVAYLPEACYARIVEGSTVVRARVAGADIGELVVTTKVPTIHPRLRTFEIKVLLKNPPAAVVPGGRVELAVILDKRKALGVPREAVVRRGGGLAVFAAGDGVARMLAVRTGLETDGLIEVDGEGLAGGMSIVRMGQDRLNDGTGIMEVKEDAE